MLFAKEKVKLSERERQMLAMEKENASVIGRRFKMLFMISIASIIATLVSFAAAYIEAGIGVTAVVSGIILVFGILFDVVLFKLGKYNSDFTMAAIASIMAQISEFFRSLCPPGVATMFSVATTALSIAYVIKLTMAMQTCLTRADGYLSEDWEKYRKFFIILMIFTIGCTLLVFFPGAVKAFAAIGILLAAIASIALSVWQVVLFYRSANAMTAFSQRPIEE